MKTGVTWSLSDSQAPRDWSCHGFMRVLVVDQDSTLLTAITRTLGEYFSIDAVTNKADCLDLVRLNVFDVIVAGERLEDGSGLELLGQLAHNRPDMLRIFAAERERLKLLRGKLGPFGLFRTLTYPIQPRQLLAALSASVGTEEDNEETTEAEAEAAPPTPPPAPEPTARRAALAAAPVNVSAPAPMRAPGPSAFSAPAPTRTPGPSAFSAPAPTRTPGPSVFSAPAPFRTAASAPVSTPAQNPRGGRPASTPSQATNNTPTVQPAPVRRTSASSAAAQASAAKIPGALRQVPRQPTSAALAAAGKLDIVTRPKGFPPPGDTSPGRSAFLVGAGVILVVGGLALSFKIFNTEDEPVATANVSATRSPHFPPEVVKLVADTEVAFQQDKLKTARTDVAALQQIAPDHPRLPFFESLLKRLEATNRESSAKAASARIFSRRASTADTSGASAPAIPSRQPDIDRDGAATSTAVATPVSATTASTTFTGRTLEDSSAGTSATQPAATPSQAIATAVPRRPGSPTVNAPDVQEPRLIQHVAAEYPPEAARKRIEGSVDVSFTVSSQGKVSDILVTNAEPSEIFNRAAVAAVRGWKYEPKTVNGVSVETHLQLRLQFKLDQRGR